MKFEIDSEACTLTVNYLDTVWNIGEEKVQRDLIYNSVAAMAAIDNLSGITYNFPVIVIPLNERKSKMYSALLCQICLNRRSGEMMYKTN